MLPEPRKKALLSRDNLLFLKTEILAGMTTGIAQVPEAVAFSIAASVPPVHGLYSTWIVGMVTALVGARPAQISGTAGSLVVVMGPLVKSHGLGYLFYAVMLSGIIQMVFGALTLARFTHLIPASAMMGFCNGLAVLIGVAQLSSFKYPDDAPHHAGEWVRGVTALVMTVYVGVMMGVMHYLPRWSKMLPSSLVGILLCMAIEHGIVRPAGAHSIIISDLADVSGDLPLPVWLQSGVAMPPINGHTLSVIAPLAGILAAIGLVETLLTKQLIDGLLVEKDGRPKLSDNREAIALGACLCTCATARVCLCV